MSCFVDLSVLKIRSLLMKLTEKPTNQKKQSKNHPMF